MLLWPMAAKAPSTIEAMATKTTICCHCVGDAGEGADRGAHEQRDRGDLRRGGEEGGDRRRRALVDVGRPHVERHGGDLEGEPGDQEDEAEDQADAVRPGVAAAMPAKLGRAGEAVDQRAP